MDTLQNIKVRLIIYIGIKETIEIHIMLCRISINHFLGKLYIII